jgi:hypothetical protein
MRSPTPSNHRRRRIRRFLSAVLAAATLAATVPAAAPAHAPEPPNRVALVERATTTASSPTPVLTGRVV